MAATGTDSPGPYWHEQGSSRTDHEIHRAEPPPEAGLEKSAKNQAGLFAKLDDVLKAAGKSVDVKDGGTITLNSIEKTADGKYKLALRMANMQRGNPFGGRILINGNVIIQNQVRIVGGRNVGGLGQGLPELVNAQGRKYSVEQIPSRRSTFINGQMSQDLTVIYGGPAGAGEPRSLVLNGEETVDFQVPFRFTNVPLRK